MITEKMSSFNIHKLTEEQYQSAFEAGEIDELAMYLTPDEAQEDPTTPDTPVTAKAERVFSLDKVACIGDSFLHGTYARKNASVAPYGWGEALRDLVRLQNPDAKFSFWYEGGSGYVSAGIHAGKTFADHITNLADFLAAESAKGTEYADVSDGVAGSTHTKRLDIVHPDEIETVIIIGGVNDANNGYQVDFTAVVDNAKARFKNAKIVLAMNPLCSRFLQVQNAYNQDPPNGQPNPVTNDFFRQLMSPSEFPEEVHILTDSCNWLLADESLNGDNLHPNRDGYKRIAEHLLYASYGIPRDYSYQYSVPYPHETSFDGAEVPSFGNVTIAYGKAGETVTFSVYGKIDKEHSGEILIGRKPTWMSRANPVVLPLGLYVNGNYTALANTYLAFKYGGTFLVVPEHPATDLVLYGTAIASIESL